MKAHSTLLCAGLGLLSLARAYVQLGPTVRAGPWGCRGGRAPARAGGAGGKRAAVTPTMVQRQVPRMPSSEPQVPYRSPHEQVATWMSVSQRLQRSRIILVGRFIDDEYANQLIAMLIYLEKEDRVKPINLYFNSPGALIRPGLAVYDTIMHMACPIKTLNLGLATGMVSFLCGCGVDRAALPNARFLMQRTGMEDQYQGQASDVGLEVAQVKSMNDRMEEAMQRITGRSAAQIHEEFQRDFYLSAAEAVQYGLIDQVVLPAGKAHPRQQYSDMQISGGGRRPVEDNPSFGSFGGNEQKYGKQSGGGWGGTPGTTPDVDGPDTGGAT